ncbi:helix-turn-helix domain-containing protein [Thalassotalea agarivorans]|uniref:AraC family transcriptional regulator n=1 Tax=Thalassotalea agarivorans TaxID=349064 RepID=A0A1H9ZUA0_THASX|nr:AraC family transcriptional regulator [Thalassotalea agarivorans]SES85357.1 AraC family transcriptional regulator [Thalassotalea agarivorans]
MKSQLQFFDHESNKLSDCGEVLEIEVSSAGLNWQGVILEKGCSPHFYPNNVYTPYFYFALALDQELSWQVETPGGMQALKSAPGNIWINPPATPFTHDIAEPCYFIILAIEEDTLLAQSPFNLTGKSLQFLNNYNVEDDTIKGIIELFFLDAKAGGQNGSAFVSNLLSLLASHYIKHYSNYLDLAESKTTVSKFDASHIQKIDNYIENNLGTNVSIDELAQQVHCSKFHFLREFKKLMSVTPYQYLISKRLEAAKTMMTNGTTNIAEVAHATGFNDQAHFTRAFKTQFEQTPGQYLKQL